MKTILIFTLTILSINTFAQDFEKGFYIENNGKRVDCLIKNIDWLYNPESFEYKLNENDTDF